MATMVSFSKVHSSVAPWGLIFGLLLLCGWPAKTLSDDSLNLNQYHGQVVYVDFWASWCTPCRASFPWMNDLYTDFNDSGLVILAVNTGDDETAANKFLQQNPAQFTIVPDTDGEIARAYRLKGMPMSYLYDRDGKLHSTHIGFTNKRAPGIRSEIEALLQQGNQ